ncbi:hypothetical protein RQP46_006712 [Phenoliferia psychrophenolica]
MIHHLKSLQTTICSALEAFEPTARFASSYSVRDAHEGFSDGRVLAHGETFEKAGCNISVTHSVLNPQMVHQMKAERFEWWDGEAELPFFVASISCVIHPHNPHAPTTHFNYRYFEVMDPTEPKGSPKAWWFAGGTDLTPSYLYDDDARLFHGVFKTECDKHNPEYYPAFKKWCDKYFYIPHRRETRGIGGIFFDDLADGTPEELFRFVRDCSNAFLPAYFPLVERRRNQAFSEGEKEWQQIRRGHYVEFNLMIDRGTKFGLAMKDPRTESILVSMPLTARWQYEPVQGTVEGSPEKRLMDVVQNPVEASNPNATDPLHQQTMATIHLIAPEILNDIFKLAHDPHKPSTLCAAALVCRAWRDLAQRTLFLDIAIPIPRIHEEEEGVVDNLNIDMLRRWDAYKSTRLCPPHLVELWGRGRGGRVDDPEPVLDFIVGVKVLIVASLRIKMDFFGSPKLRVTFQFDRSSDPGVFRTGANPLLSLAGSLPTSIKRLCLTQVSNFNTIQLPHFYATFSEENLPNLKRIDSPDFKRKDLEDAAGATDLLAECERRSIRVVCWEEFL